MAAKPIRIVQVSDTHLSRKRAYFHDNWEVFLAEMNASPPDLIVHSGDISFDGAADGDDLEFAKAELDRLPSSWIAIPGNHDIGESHIAVRLDQPVDDERIARWTRTVGAQWWVRDVGDWRLIGIDTSLLGTKRADSDAQWAFLQRALETRDGRPLMLFQHMPPFLKDPSDRAFTALAVPHTVRGQLLDACAAGDEFLQYRRAPARRLCGAEAGLHRVDARWRIDFVAGRRAAADDHARCRVVEQGPRLDDEDATAATLALRRECRRLRIKGMRPAAARDLENAP